MLKKITEVARVIRSKNCSPFELTLDIIFEEDSIYKKVKQSNLINAKVIAEAYGIAETKINSIIYFDPAHAVKINIPRPVASGAPGDTDVYGAQQHAPLLKIKLQV